MKKLAVLMLALLICAASLTSCFGLDLFKGNEQETSDKANNDSVSDVEETEKNGNTDSENESGSGDVEASESEEDDDVEYDENGYEKDDLGEDLNFKSKEIRISGWSEVENKYPEFGVKELGSNLVSNAAYLKNMAVQKRLNVRLKFDTVKGWTGPGDGSGQEQLTRVQNAAATGEIDLIGTYSWNACTFMVNAYISNLNNMPYLDLTQPWWNASIVEKSSIYGNIYYATGDISSAYIGNTYAMFFNDCPWRVRRGSRR